MGEGPRRTLRFARDLLAGLARRKDAVPIDQLIQDLLDATGYEAILLCQPQGRRLAGNVRRLMELARPGAAGPLSLAEFLAEMREHVMDQSRYEQAAVVTEAEDVVRLMTIHKAKGLEFPVVVLPDLSAGRDARTSDLLHRPDMGLTYRAAEAIDDELGEAEAADKPLTYRLAAALEAEDLRKEDIRRLYVAATRAQDHLIFIGADWRDKEGRLRESGSHLRTMDKHLHLAECADGDGQLEYADAGHTYHAIVRKVPPPPATRSGASPSAGRRMLAAADSPDALCAAILAAAQIGGSKTPMPHPPPLLGPLPASVGTLDISVTALSEFDHCPMLYRWRYELCVPAAEKRDVPHFPQRKMGYVPLFLGGAELGTLLHRCMELLDFGRPQTAERLIHLAAGDLDLPPEVTREDLGRQFQPMLETFLRHPLGRRLAAAPARLTELEFLLAEGPLRLSGKIDLLWQDDLGAWHIVDYKSDRAEGADLTEYARRYELQMTAYALAASRHLAGGGKPPVADASLYFLRRGEVQAIAVTPANLRSASQRLAEVANRLVTSRRTGDFPSCRTPACEYCPFGDYCRAASPG
jgi:ATP-dependent helicase/nuclease subunit A